MGTSRNSYKILVAKLDWNRPLGRLRCRWEDNIKTDLREIRWEIVDWLYLAQGRDQWRALVKTAMILRDP
jgi:hypothetical protein